MFLWSLRQLLFVVPPCISTQLLTLPRTQFCNLSTVLGFTLVPWQAFCTRCCNACKSLIDTEYTEAFRCPHSQTSRGLRSGGHASQLTGPPHPIYCSLKVYFRRVWQCEGNGVVPHHACTPKLGRSCKLYTTKSMEGPSLHNAYTETGK
jgi:hypothetical protein